MHGRQADAPRSAASRAVQNLFGAGSRRTRADVAAKETRSCVVNRGGLPPRRGFALTPLRGICSSRSGGCGIGTEGELKAERGPLAEYALHPDLAAVQI